MPPSLDQQAHARLLAALGAMTRKYPYHSALTGADRFTADPSVGTMCVMLRNDRVVYRYAPRFVVRCAPEELLGVLHHEVNHVLFGHPQADPRQYPNRQARMIAEEVTVNEYVPEPLPGAPIVLAQFQFLPPFEDTDTRYRRLAERDDLPRNPRPLDNHTLWCNPETLSESELHHLLAQVRSPWELPEAVREAAFRRAAAHRGRRAPPTIEQLGGSPPPAERLDWKPIFERASGFSAQREATFRRPPRRLPQWIGVLPGRRMQTTGRRIMAVVDTSRSMTRDYLEAVLRELRHLSSLGSVTVVECDNQIRGTYRLRDRIERVAGRGSTDLRPAFEPRFLAEHQPDVVVYFTDGEGPAPDQSPRVPVIWCLTPGGKRPAAWGLTVGLPVGGPPGRN